MTAHGTSPESAATCAVCPHACTIEPASTGLCGARGAQDGRVVSLNHGHATALSLDPVEKKPLTRFHPGARILSYGSFGCNMACAFCQNASISQVRICGHPETALITPEELVEKAAALRDAGNVGVALTYNEPLIAPEFLLDVGRLTQAAGLAMAVVTNGYATPEAFDAACTVTDAMNVDVKCFTEEGYAQLGAPGGLGVVRRNVQAALEAGVHVELTTLIVPGLSDAEEAFREEIAWIASLSPEIPLHLSRFFPQHQMANAAPTSIAVMERFQDIARGQLSHVFLGNL